MHCHCGSLWLVVGCPLCSTKMQYVVCLAVSSHLRTSHCIYQNCNKVFVSALCLCCILEKKFVYKLKLQLYHVIFLVCFELQTELFSIAVTSTFIPPPIFFSLLSHLTPFFAHACLKIWFVLQVCGWNWSVFSLPAVDNPVGHTVWCIVHVTAVEVCARTSFEPISSPTLD
jgi:hypothetical protein